MVQRMFDNSRIDSLTIHLDSKVPHDPTTGCPVFYPLQFITGKVVWTTRTPKAADNVVMVFRGWSKTRVAKLDSPKSTKRSAHSEEMTLFRLESKLDKGPRTFEPGTYEWPFQWVFPQRAYVSFLNILDQINVNKLSGMLMSPEAMGMLTIRCSETDLTTCHQP